MKDSQNSNKKDEDIFETMCSFESLVSAHKRAVCAGRYKNEKILFYLDDEYKTEKCKR